MDSSQTDDIRNRLVVARLPAMPQILLKLIELCQADEAGMAELAKLIANDAGITSRVLHVANSAAYQRSGRKVGLVQALSTLGSDLIKTLVISESVLQTFNDFPHTESTDLRGFWKHSLTAAVLARDIAKSMNYPQVEEAYLAGLLHDVGRLALLAAAPDTYQFNFHCSAEESLCALETRLLHISHAEAGAWLIDRWAMDSFLADSVLYHHEPIDRVVNAPVLVRIVHLAHRLSDLPQGQDLTDNLGAICNLSDTDLLAIHQAAQGQVLKAAEFLGIDLTGADTPSPATPQVAAATVANPVQQRLIEEIRNRALLAELGQMFSNQKDQAQLLESIRQNARVFFDLDDSAVFLIRPNRQALVAACVGEQRQRLTEFAIALNAGGVIADAMAQRNLGFLQSRATALSLAEQQLLRAFATPCVLCLPLCTGNRCLGMLLAGMAAWRLPKLQQQAKLLLAYGMQAAQALEAAAKTRSEIEQRLASAHEEHLKNSRKVVHEASNPLAIIKNYLAVLNDKLTRQEPVAGELEILNEEIDRVGNIIKEFAGVTTPVAGNSFDINKVITDIVRLFRESRFLPSTVQIAARLTALPCALAGSVDPLKQILVNLLKNAVEALPQGGHIEIVNLGATRFEGADYFAISIRDSGPGLPVEVLAHLYSPVRSSKAGDNRGLGLSIVHSLVKKLGGHIDCKSSRMGTSFELLLPVVANRTVHP